MDPAPPSLPPEVTAPMPYGKIFRAVFGGLLVAIVALGGSFMLGTYLGPSAADKRDGMRSYDLTFIDSGIREIYKADRKLPTTLDEVRKRWTRQTPLSILDPVYNVPYEYRVMSADTYELCAHFETRIDKGPFRHPEGRFCVATTLE